MSVVTSVPKTPALTGALTVVPMRHCRPVGMSKAPASGAKPVIVSKVPDALLWSCIVTTRAPPPTASWPLNIPYAPSPLQRPACRVNEGVPGAAFVSVKVCRSLVAATPRPPNCIVAPAVRSTKSPARAWVGPESPWLSKSVLESCPGKEMPALTS